MEQRSEDRISRNVGIFVHIYDCEQFPQLVDKSFPCEAIDFSPHGLQFRSDLSLPTHTLINISVGIGQPFSMYYLFAEVRWVRVTDEETLMGIKLIDKQSKDLDKWLSDFERNFTNFDQDKATTLEDVSKRTTSEVEELMTDCDDREPFATDSSDNPSTQGEISRDMSSSAENETEIEFEYIDASTDSYWSDSLSKIQILL